MKGKFQKHGGEEGQLGKPARITQQKNNFKLGNADKEFKTTSIKHYGEKLDLAQQNGLPQDKLADLKSHHINYGEYGTRNQTVQQVSYDYKTGEQGNSNQQKEQ